MKIVLSFLALCFIVSACKKDDDVYAPGNRGAVSTAEIIRVTGVSKTSLDADSAAITKIEVAIDAEADITDRKVVFTTSTGNFLNGKSSDTVTANAFGSASISLLSSTAGTARVTAKTKSIVVDTSVVFVQALPDDMLITLDKYTGDTNAIFTVTNPLVRNPGRGKVTDPVKVFYTVTPVLPTSNNLIYPPFAFSSGRQASITITNPFHYKGSYNIQAKTVSATGVPDTLRRNAVITIL